MIRIFIYKNKIINVDNTVDAENLLKKDAWEMPERDVQAVFGDKASMACNQYCTFTKTETGYDVTFTPPQKDIEQLKQQKLHEAERLLSQKLNMLSAGGKCQLRGAGTGSNCLFGEYRNCQNGNSCHYGHCSRSTSGLD
jgi:hypothetical protein